MKSIPILMHWEFQSKRVYLRAVLIWHYIILILSIFSQRSIVKMNPILAMNCVDIHRHNFMIQNQIRLNFFHSMICWNFNLAPKDSVLLSFDVTVGHSWDFYWTQQLTFSIDWFALNRLNLTFYLFICRLEQYEDLRNLRHLIISPCLCFSQHTDVLFVCRDTTPPSSPSPSPSSIQSDYSCHLKGIYYHFSSGLKCDISVPGCVGLSHTRLLTNHRLYKRQQHTKRKVPAIAGIPTIPFPL